MTEEMYAEPHWATDRVLWRNSQWAVTDYGIENVAGPYHYAIEAIAITAAHRWPDHMAGKWWVDRLAFEECYAQAVSLLQGRG